jgi:hypothetical protein
MPTTILPAATAIDFDDSKRRSTTVAGTDDAPTPIVSRFAQVFPMNLVPRDRTSPSRPASCMLQLAHQGPCWAVLLFGGAATAIIAGTSVALLAIAMIVAGLAVASTSPRFREMVAIADRRARRAERRHERERRLIEVHIPRDQLRALGDLVDEIDAISPQDVDLYDLEGLLDHYVALAVEHERLERLLTSTELGPMIHSLRRSPDTPPKLRQSLVERRLELWGQTRARADALAEHLGAVEELVRLIAQRAALGAHSVELDSGRETGLLEACLEQLDGDDELRASLEAAS